MSPKVSHAPAARQTAQCQQGRGFIYLAAANLRSSSEVRFLQAALESAVRSSTATARKSKESSELSVLLDLCTHRLEGTEKQLLKAGYRTGAAVSDSVVVARQDASAESGQCAHPQPVCGFCCTEALWQRLRTDGLWCAI